MEKVKFGIIGCGLMGREFASAAARWCHLEGDIPAPEIIGISDTNAASFGWFDKHFPGIKKKSSDCNELLNMKEIETVKIQRGIWLFGRPGNTCRTYTLPGGLGSKKCPRAAFKVC